MFMKPAFGAQVRRSRRRLVVFLLLLSFFSVALHAQKAEKPARKLLVKTTPDYPWDLRRSHIGGLVRLNLLISPNGAVDKVTVIGGNPILAETASKAVKPTSKSKSNSIPTTRTDRSSQPLSRVVPLKQPLIGEVSAGHTIPGRLGRI